MRATSSGTERRRHGRRRVVLGRVVARRLDEHPRPLDEERAQSPAWASTRRRARASVVAAAAPPFDAFASGSPPPPRGRRASRSQVRVAQRAPTSANAARACGCPVEVLDRVVGRLRAAVSVEDAKVRVRRLGGLGEADDRPVLLVASGGAARGGSPTAAPGGAPPRSMRSSPRPARAERSSPAAARFAPRGGGARVRGRLVRRARPSATSPCACSRRHPGDCVEFLLRSRSRNAPAGGRRRRARRARGRVRRMSMRRAAASSRCARARYSGVPAGHGAAPVRPLRKISTSSSRFARVLALPKK